MMKVMVDRITMESENRARNWASLDVHGYSVVQTLSSRLYCTNEKLNSIV